MTAVCEYIWSAYSVIAQIIYARTAQMTIMKHDVDGDWPAYQYGRDLFFVTLVSPMPLCGAGG